MSTALTILLLTTMPADADNAFAHAFIRSAREAVGADAQIDLRRLAVFPADDRAASMGVDLHADAVVELSWSMPDELRAKIHCFRPNGAGWADLEIGFRPVDIPAERARTLAFALASFFPARESSFASQPAATSTESAAKILEPRTHLVSRRAIDAVGVVGMGTGDSGGTVGGTVDFRFGWASSFAARLGATLRAGEIPAAQITTTLIGGAVGVVWEAWSAPNARAGLGLRLDGLVYHCDFGHLVGDDQTVHQDKWMLGADLLAEASWFFAEGAAVVGGGGAEAVFGRTEIRIGERTFATLAPVRPVAELGLRIRF